MTSTLEPSTLVMRDPDIIATDMDGEMVMMSIEQGHYYGLGGIGPFLWEQVVTPTSIKQLCQRVLQEYEVDEATCRADVSAFVNDLLGKGVLRLGG